MYNEPLCTQEFENEQKKRRTCIPYKRNGALEQLARGRKRRAIALEPELRRQDLNRHAH